MQPVLTFLKDCSFNAKIEILYENAPNNVCQW